MIGFHSEALEESNGLATGTRRSREHVNEELARRGYQRSKHADMTVRLANGRREVQDHLSPEMVDEFAEYDETEGSLVVDVFDNGSHRRLYHGVARDFVSPDRVDDDQVKEAVHRMLAGLPSAGH
jgi:hypothetical protein